MNIKARISKNTKKRAILFFSLLLLSILISCGNQPLESKNLNSGFINEAGIYHISNQKRRNILVQELKDGSIIFAIRNSTNKILFQQSLNETLSKYHYWTLYVDSNSNLWYYNSDYDSPRAILFDEKTQQYNMVDFCERKLKLPKEFKKELELKNSLENCLSLTEIKK
ncbi:hypothetical protein [Flavobacterium bizetiae]|uniref:hypothetical protein n=1 Tax=Flavobacterium bizetiae TaxID=2704140 RepID=UPI003756A038